MVEPLRGSLIALLFAALAGAGATPSALERFEFTHVHMGMPVRIVLYAADLGRAESAARAAFDRIAALDSTLSDYKPESELTRLSQRAGTWVGVSTDLYRVLSAACEIATASQGAFDPTVGPLTALWRESRRSGRPPSPESLAEARALVSWRFVEFDPDSRAIRLTRRGMRLDLGGIAKGFILQEALAVLDRRGAPAALLEAGGDIVVGDPPPGRSGWDVDARYADDRFRARARSLSRVALATSGPTSQYVDINGRRYSHVIDPRNGAALTSSRVASVIARDGLWADGLATLLGVIDDAEIAATMSSFPVVVAWSIGPRDAAGRGPQPEVVGRGLIAK
jgi:thiamine biosynthesis lipoprotein